MTRIRLDIDELRREAREIEEAAADVHRLASGALAATEAAPTIAGQFGPEVRALGQELRAAYEGEAASLEERAQDLEAIAARFEAVDQELETRFSAITADVRALLLGLEWLGAEPGGKVRGLAMPVPIGGDDDDEDDEDEGSLEKFLQSVLKQFWSLGFMWMTVTDKAVGRWMAKLKDLGPVVIPLPWLRGLGPGVRIDPFDPNVLRGTLDDFAGPLLKSIEVDDVVRAVGRAVGDASVAPLFAIGWGLTLLPEQIRNLMEGADLSEVAADFEVDSGGFLVGEGAGWLAAAAATLVGYPHVSPAAKIVADVIAGGVWDTLADTGGWRETAAEALRTLGPSGEGLPAAEQAPAPPPGVEGTPTPPEGRAEGVVIPSPVPIPCPEATSTPTPGGP